MKIYYTFNLGLVLYLAIHIPLRFLMVLKENIEQCRLNIICHIVIPVKVILKLCRAFTSAQSREPEISILMGYFWVSH